MNTNVKSPKIAYTGGVLRFGVLDFFFLYISIESSKHPKKKPGITGD